MRRTLSVIGASVLFVVVGLLIKQGGVDFTEYSTQLAVILTTMSIGLLVWGFRPTFVHLFREKPISDLSVEISRPLDPKFKIVEARLFYPRTISRERRDPKKVNPYHKLILIKDLKKAYYVGSYAWNLILTNKIEWFTEDDQDIEEWCKKEGYVLVKEDATEDYLLEPYFDAEIRKKKASYRQGELVLFRTHYRGDLVNGFFDNEILPPNGQVFSDGRPRAWSWAPDTLDNEHPATRGNLNGYVNHKSKWSWRVPQDAPTGEYRLYMRVYNHLDINNRPVIDEKEDTFFVI